MKKNILNLILILIVNGIYCQTKFDYQTVNFDFIGYIYNQPIYQFYPAKESVVGYKRDVYYTPNVNRDNQIVSFTKYNKGEENAILVHNNISFKYSKKILYKTVNGNENFVELRARLNRNVSYSTSNEKNNISSEVE